jgi:hypothetical protein
MRLWLRQDAQGPLEFLYHQSEFSVGRKAGYEIPQRSHFLSEVGQPLGRVAQSNSWGGTLARRPGHCLVAHRCFRMSGIPLLYQKIDQPCPPRSPRSVRSLPTEAGWSLSNRMLSLVCKHPSWSGSCYQSPCPIELTETMRWRQRHHTSTFPSIEAGHGARPEMENSDEEDDPCCRCCLESDRRQCSSCKCRRFP